MDNDLRAGEGREQFLLQPVDNIVGGAEAQTRRNVRMQLNKRLGTGIAGFQVMVPSDFRHAFNRFDDFCLIRIRHFAVHQVVERPQANIARAIQHHHGNQHRNGRIRPAKPQLRIEKKRQQHARVEQHISRVMEAIGSDNQRAGAPRHHPLKQHQPNGNHQRTRTHPNADGLVGELVRIKQPFSRLQHNHQHAGADERGLRQPRNILNRAMAEAVVVIRRFQRVADGEEVHQRAEHVEQRIGEGGQHGDGFRRPPGVGFCAKQHKCKARRGNGGNAHQPWGIGIAVMGVGVMVRVGQMQR